MKDDERKRLMEVCEQVVGMNLFTTERLAHAPVKVYAVADQNFFFSADHAKKAETTIAEYFALLRPPTVRALLERIRLLEGLLREVDPDGEHGDFPIDSEMLPWAEARDRLLKDPQ